MKIPVGSILTLRSLLPLKGWVQPNDVLSPYFAGKFMMCSEEHVKLTATDGTPEMREALAKEVDFDISEQELKALQSCVIANAQHLPINLHGVGLLNALGLAPK